MKKQTVSRRGFLQGSSAAGLALMGSAESRAFAQSQASSQAGAMTQAPGVSGQGAMKFRVKHTSSLLPAAAQKVLVKAHGGFAVDRRPGRGETYFFLIGAGILQIAADLNSIRLLDTAETMRQVNLHDTTLWFDPKDGAPYLVFPANDAGKIFTTALDGTLLSTLDAPPPDHEFEPPEVRDYFQGGGNFAPTGAAYLDGLYYFTTGYSKLDYVLTARVMTPSRVEWSDLAFGGKGDGRSQFQTAHAVTVHPDSKRLDITDRPHSEVKQFGRYGHYLSTLKMPMGSLPCSIDYLDQYALIPTLVGPDPAKGAPIYLFESSRLISTIFPKADLGLANFEHNHKAVLHKAGDKLCIVVQAWNPGDFAILEQV
ncbi:MAG: twin-arginine translocation signal domain-containing protein [Terriglobia bacterium]